MKKLLSLLVLIASMVSVSYGQMRNFPALDTNNHFTGTNQMDGNTLLAQSNNIFYVGALYTSPQAAVTAACNLSVGRAVVVPAGSSSGVNLATITGCSNVYITDQRSAVPKSCIWTGAVYSCSSGSNAVTSVFTRLGDVVAQTGDYNFGQISGTLTPGQLPLSTNTQVGAVKPDNSTIAVAGDGTLTVIGGIGVGSLSSLTAATASNTLANGNNAQVWNWAQTSTNQIAFTVGETSAATGSGDSLALFKTLAGSTAIPLTVVNSLSGSQTFPTLQILPTWNTSGKADAAILVNVTNVASGSGSLLFDLQVAASSLFSVDKSGAAVAAGGVTAGSTSSGVGGLFTLPEGTAASGVSGQDVCYGDSTAHAIKCSFNNGSFFTLGSGSGSSGTVTNTAGALTVNHIMIGNNTVDSKIDSVATLDGSGNFAAFSASLTGTSGVGGGWLFSVGTATASSAGFVSIWGDIGTGRFMVNNSGAGAVNVPTIATAGTVNHAWGVTSNGLDMVDIGAVQGAITVPTVPAHNFLIGFGGSSFTFAQPASTDLSDGSNLAKLASANIYTVSGAASAPAALYNGTPFTGGSGTTTLPMFFFQPSATTNVTNWSTSGTFMGVDAPSGFSGFFLDFRLNGSSTPAFNVASNGAVTANSITSSATIMANQYRNTVVTVTASATPSLASTNGLQTITLNANATPTIGTILAGQRITFEICQPATGGPFTWTWPATIHGGNTGVGSMANSTCLIQSFDSFSSSSLVAESVGITGVAP